MEKITLQCPCVLIFPRNPAGTNASLPVLAYTSAEPINTNEMTSRYSGIIRKIGLIAEMKKTGRSQLIEKATPMKSINCVTPLTHYGMLRSHLLWARDSNISFQVRKCKGWLSVGGWSASDRLRTLCLVTAEISG